MIHFQVDFLIIVQLACASDSINKQIRSDAGIVQSSLDSGVFLAYPLW